MGCNMKLGIITPIGPGHENAYRSCSASIDAAIKKGTGAFKNVEKIPVYDLHGEIGRSAARNKGIRLAAHLNCDWVFFLDADDLLFDEAFIGTAPYLENYDAIWGIICEAPYNRLDQVKVRENQTIPLLRIEDFLANDPFVTLQMVTFVRRSIVDRISFDETTETGEDFKFYIALWKDCRCIKTNKIFFVNIRGNHSIGPRSANGQMWRTAVQRELSNARKVIFTKAECISNSMTLVNQDTLILELSGKSTFTVFNHWFWSEFVNGWEPQTWNFYHFFSVEGRPVIDIGSWIGPTALIAVVNGASKVILVEANPVTLNELNITKMLDAELDEKWQVIEGCVSDRDGIIEFGPETGELRSTSASSDRGSGSKVPSLRYNKIMKSAKEPSIIKIDIEGTEIKILEDIINYSPDRSAIWLSWHPPLWEKVNLNYHILKELLQNHFVLNSALEPIEISTLWKMISSIEKTPYWGTPYGNFFETAILSKKSFDINGNRLE